MMCEKCKGEMYWSIEGSIQGWRCDEDLAITI